MKRFLQILVILFIVLGSVLLIFKPNKYDFKAFSENKEVSLYDFNGEYKIIYFGYLFCPDVCPTTLFTVSNVLDEIKRDDIKLIFITLDPERDTPKELTNLVLHFYKNSIGLKLKELDVVAKNYGVKFKKIELPKSAMIYSVAHSSSLYLIDKNGKFYTEVSNLTEEDIKEAILNMIRERP